MPIKLAYDDCTGCKMCQLACSAAHEGVFNPEKARLKIIHEYNDTGIRISSKHCIHCGKCARVCPEGAITDNGRWMIVDTEKCVGCGTCVENCPKDVIYLDGAEKAVICDLCEGEPQCVAWCPKGVISLFEKKGATR